MKGKRHPQILIPPALWRPSLRQHKITLQVPVLERPSASHTARALARAFLTSPEAPHTESHQPLPGQPPAALPHTTASFAAGAKPQKLIHR